MRDIFETDIVVIGAGVVGLACARRLAMAGWEVLVIEAQANFGQETSSRNSEVLHAGIYYPRGSLKAQFCVSGQAQLYDYCQTRAIPHRRCGKLIVATETHELSALETFFEGAEKNGAKPLSLISGQEAKRLEPALADSVAGAIYSQGTGVIDSHSYMVSLSGELEDHGGNIALNTTVTSGEILSDGVILETGGENPVRVKSKWVINSAGHNAVGVAAKIDGPHVPTLPKTYFAKGSYFAINGAVPFSRLIYPMPSQAGLGVHLTLDLAGQGKLGPNVDWLPDGAVPPFDYSVDAGLRDRFYQSATKFWPALKAKNLSPSYSGVRPKIVGQGEAAGDFIIGHLEDSGLINLFGIESPGLTASLAIAEKISEYVH